MEKNIGFNRNVIEGIYAFSQKKKNWVFYDTSPDADLEQTCKHWKLDAAICHINTDEVAKVAEELAIPIVNTTDSLVGCKLPLVDVNHFKVGEMAGIYLKNLGVKSFGYLGHPTLQYSKQRQSAFLETVSDVSEAHVCHVGYTPTIKSMEEAQQARETMKKWIQRLPKPTAVFCSNDIPARDLADVCLEMGVSVPKDISILGVDNDFVECRLSRPPLSSIDIPAARVGYAAAEMIDDMLQGNTPRYDGHYSPDPVRVVERESTTLNAVEDENVRKVLDYIDSHIGDVQKVEQLVALVPLSRRSLELRVQSCLGRSLWDIVLEKRINYARILLQQNELSLQQVSDACGFASSRRFYAIFRKYCGCNPTAFRKMKNLS
ncbi:substrate-binding domain-containing protein [Rubritalea sp.]|uniref:substrate-binding domain-containing protein n=1 Tax=Rubritalea sp. TaxID=2109375 RepID=UPI003F4AD137